MLPVGLLTHRFILGLSSQIYDSVTVGFVCDYSGGAVPLNNNRPYSQCSQNKSTFVLYR
jgi:hypothetical protein